MLSSTLKLAPAFFSPILPAYELQDVFDVHSLDLAFGFNAPPKVELSIRDKARRKAPQGKGAGKGGARSGHAFSASNPYGVRDPNDKRQFVR